MIIEYLTTDGGIQRAESSDSNIKIAHNLSERLSRMEQNPAAEGLSNSVIDRCMDARSFLYSCREAINRQTR